MDRKFLLGIIALMISLTSFAQVGVNTETPAATLDVTANLSDATPEGVIAPRLTGDQLKAADSQYGTAQIGAIVYATAAVTTASTKTVNVTVAGYYYFDGTVWQMIIGGTEWLISGTTTDAQSDKVGAISRSGRVGIGTLTPATKLDIKADASGTGFKMVDGTQGVGKIMTSDTNGVGMWQTQWFYLPSFNLDLSTVTNGKTVNLYEVYSNQFTKSSNTKFVSNNAALTSIPDQPVYAVSQLDFAVTDYDDTVIKVTSIDNNGIMTYDVLRTNASPDSYINIICIVK
ncbi:hypothetical protein [Dysgonomonas macrotermitis]|uniref:Uncharacterized protein n=1 Tax=Dysgonomonas macrotermitis TaxID=1346286 RepID=A0A1M5E4X9_9BACT|nr:hypothetical protein [Dysgonomonas macrotermitis]SHF74194.1 hypothetical protein SAMN05444362_109147 [Dysgonomonas macrotermitis]